MRTVCTADSGRGAGTPTIPPELLEQLAPTGRLLLCVGPPDETQAQTLVVADARDAGRRREVVIKHTMMHALT